MATKWLTWVGGGTVLLAVGLWLSQAIKTPEVEPVRDRAVVTIPYLGAIPDEDPREGVVASDETRVQPGLTLMTSTGRRQTMLVDLDGTVRHTWTIEAGAYATVDAEGNLYVEQGSMGLAKLDWNSKPVWKHQANVHHDVWLADDGGVVTLERWQRPLSGTFGTVPVLSDWIVELSPEGTLKRRISLFPVASPLISSQRLDQIGAAMASLAAKGKDVSLAVAVPDTPFDVMHTNSVFGIDRRIEGVAEPGDYLVSIREVHLVAIVRPTADAEPDASGAIPSTLVWRYEGPTAYQHHATLLDNDHVLVFDNGRGHDVSTALEIDPRTQKVVWQYRGPSDDPLYSGWRGSAQRLPNGNTLIAESDRGRVIEVTPGGEVVWEYLMHRKSADKREPVYRAIRITGELEAALRRKL